MKVGSFQGLLPQGHAEFDSGMVGFIYVTRENILKNWNRKKLSRKLVKQATDLLYAEVNTYDSYLSGQVYGYQVIKDVECDSCHNIEHEVVDSCWGYYDDSYLIEAKAQINYLVESEEVKNEARNKESENG